jgi:hypothetical protein
MSYRLSIYVEIKSQKTGGYSVHTNGLNWRIAALFDTKRAGAASIRTTTARCCSLATSGYLCHWQN